MRFTNQPRILKKQRTQMLANALGDLAIASMPASSSEAVQLIGRIPMALERLLPIGGDGAFGYVLMSFREGEAGAIYFCATHTDDGTVEYYESQGYWKVADGFPEFVAGLEAGDV